MTQSVAPRPSPPVAPQPAVAPSGWRPDTPTREVWDAEALLTWRVREHAPPAHLADRCTHCLVFDAGTTMRRVCGLGADWHRLSDEALLAHCRAPR